jgi:Lrp/AsnC family transcriptional regulator
VFEQSATVVPMNKTVRLDAIDRRILDIIQEDTDRSINQIADAVGLSANPCWRRIKRLETEGVIVRRVTLISSEAIGLGMMAFVSVRANQHNTKWVQAFAVAVKAIPEIVECHRLSGDVDYFLKVVVRDIKHYDLVYQRLIASVPNLSDVSSNISMERIKYSTSIDLTTIG